MKEEKEEKVEEKAGEGPAAAHEESKEGKEQDSEMQGDKPQAEEKSLGSFKLLYARKHVPTWHTAASGAHLRTEVKAEAKDCSSHGPKQHSQQMRCFLEGVERSE